MECLLLVQHLDGKSMIFIVLSSIETVHDTVQYRYCIFSLLNCPIVSCLIRTREKGSTLQMYNVVYSTLYYYFI